MHLEINGNSIKNRNINVGDYIELKKLKKNKLNN